MKRNCLVASLVGALVFAPEAQADVAVFDHFSVEYSGYNNSNVWNGADVSQTGNTLTFSNLQYRASAVLPAGGGISQGSYESAGLLQLTLEAGYRFTGMSFSAQGNYQVKEFNGYESFASAATLIHYGLGYGYERYTEVTSAVFESDGSGGYNKSNAFNFQTLGENWITFLTYETLGNAKAIGAGASAWISHDNASFTFNVTAVPEPETYAMLLAGLGLMGAVARRKKLAA